MSVGNFLIAPWNSVRSVIAQGKPLWIVIFDFVLKIFFLVAHKHPACHDFTPCGVKNVFFSLHFLFCGVGFFVCFTIKDPREFRK